MADRDAPEGREGSRSGSEPDPGSGFDADALLEWGYHKRLGIGRAAFRQLAEHLEERSYEGRTYRHVPDNRPPLRLRPGAYLPAATHTACQNNAHRSRLETPSSSATGVETRSVCTDCCPVVSGKRFSRSSSTTRRSLRARSRTREAILLSIRDTVETVREGDRVVTFRKLTQSTNDKTKNYLEGEIVRE
ncbi:hypothetical protein [Halobiforma nitratireducens]|uniref:Y414 protein n=1 Tax=Halobiforma nitratireducens JCM 10879 TaxID=1227454 RepID=M0MB88_9EURY|nr:hypothetical protein [Halobiforma nitratireducens]EMA43032.1 Y414 protein [Halobiforma nitratireducens JCM 10879]